MVMQIKEGTEASKKKKGSLKLSEEEENILWEYSLTLICWILKRSTTLFLSF